MHPTHNTRSENIPVQSAELLNRRVAAAIDLHGQLKQARGNVRRSAFIAVHELFDKVAGEARRDSDLIAERAAGAIQVATERSFLIPYPLRIADETQHLFAVAATPAAFGQSAHDAIGQSETLGDADTDDLSTEISRGVDHQLRPAESRVAPK